MLINVDAKVYVKFYVCSACGKEETVTSNKPISKHQTRKSGMCKKCRNAKYYIDNPNKHREILLQRRYGISIETYNKLYLEQKGCCDICKKHSTKFKQNLHVDHNHTTGKVRGLLCKVCNNNVGIYENNQIKIKEYLEKERALC